MVGQGWVLYWAQLRLQAVGFLPLKTADSLPGKGFCHALIPRSLGIRLGQGDAGADGEGREKGSGRGLSGPQHPKFLFQLSSREGPIRRRRLLAELGLGHLPKPCVSHPD